MRQIDADSLYEEISKWPGSVMCKDWVQSAIANAPTITQPTNDLLTLEELREMDGELVWVVQPHETLPPFWGIVDADDELVTGSKYCADFEGYDTEWKAYRSKPE